MVFAKGGEYPRTSLLTHRDLEGTDDLLETERVHASGTPRWHKGRHANRDNHRCDRAIHADVGAMDVDTLPALVETLGRPK